MFGRVRNAKSRIAGHGLSHAKVCVLSINALDYLRIHIEVPGSRRPLSFSSFVQTVIRTDSSNLGYFRGLYVTTQIASPIASEAISETRGTRISTQHRDALGILTAIWPRHRILFDTKATSVALRYSDSLLVQGNSDWETGFRGAGEISTAYTGQN
jgi:hypothetical protein